VSWSKGIEIPSDVADEQWVDLIGDPDGYTRLKEGLLRAGIGASSFAFDRGRRPYPGLSALTEDDAAICFGRDAQILRCLDDMRGLARIGLDRVLMIVGASGAGKSSFMRAGLWPRLKRDDRTWLPIPTIRPGGAVLSGKYGLAQKLQEVMAEPWMEKEAKLHDLPRTRGGILELLANQDDGLTRIFRAMRGARRVFFTEDQPTPMPTVVLPIDQGEELFDAEGREERERFAKIIVQTLKSDRHAVALVAIRSDAFSRAQNELFTELSKRTFVLDSMLEGSYRAVIEGPARFVQPRPLQIDPELTDALLQDVTGQDALPLLAFALERLFVDYGVDGRLSLPQYRKLGGLRGIIDEAVANAVEDAVSAGNLPRDEPGQQALLRATFVPHLARASISGRFVRRLARRDEIRPEAGPIIDRFVNYRLLVRDVRRVGDRNVEVLEVAHEALLREWSLLRKWLEEDREFLVAKESLRHDIAVWQAAPKDQKSGALLAGLKLTRARSWLLDRPKNDFSPAERGYIIASIVHSQIDQRRFLNRAVAAAILTVLAILVRSIW
jgi:hypothetical protein